MEKRSLLQEAIADAKVVKEAALANAKAQISENMSPALRKLFAEKINEMESMTDAEGLEEPIDECNDTVSSDDLYASDEYKGYMNEDDDADADDNEILFEEDEESEESEEGAEGEESEEGSEEDEEVNVQDMTAKDLTDYIESVIREMAANNELPTDGASVEGDEMIDGGDGMDAIGDDFGGDEDLGGGEDLGGAEDLGGEDEAVDLQELFSDYKRTKLAESKKVKARQVSLAESKMKAELETLRQENAKINLLNSKLMYSSKIFKNKDLTESQKVKVVNAFDKATSTKEAKLVYESLMSTFDTTSKKPTHVANRSHASSTLAGKKPITESKANIVETDPIVLRMQKLAGIIK